MKDFMETYGIIAILIFVGWGSVFYALTTMFQ